MSQKSSFSSLMLDNLKGNFLSLFGSQLLTGCLTVVAINRVTHLLGSDLYGNYTLFLTVAALFSSFWVSWIFNGIYKMAVDLHSTHRPVGQALGTGLAVVVVMLVILFMGLALAYPALSSYLSLSGTSYLLLPAFISLVAFINIVNYGYQALGHFKKYSLVLPIERILFICLIWLAEYRHISLSFQDILSYLVASHTCLFVLITLGLDRKAVGKLEFQPALLKRLIHFSKPYILTNITLYLASSIDIYFIEHSQTKQQLGIYYLALQFLNISNQILLIGNTILTHTFIAVLAEKKMELVRHFYRYLAPKALLTLSFLFLAGTFVLRHLFPLFFSAEFAPALKLMLWLTLALQSSALFILFHPLLFAQEDSRKISLLTILPVALSIPLCFIFISQQGILAATWIRILAAGMTALLALFYCRSDLTPGKMRMVGIYVFGQFLLFANLFIETASEGLIYAAVVGVLGFIAIQKIGLLRRQDWVTFRKLKTDESLTFSTAEQH